MALSTTIRIDDLRAWLLAILDEIERKYGAEFDLGADYYWDVDGAAAFDMGSDPVPDVGQLSDDVETLGGFISEREGHEVIVWHDLAHAVGILKGIAALDLPGPAPK
jgi:hypothetical protein